MKNNIFQIFFFFLAVTCFSQGVFFNQGKNFSSIMYKNRSAFLDRLKINGVGDAYELGYTDTLNYKKIKDLKYTGSVTLNDYNATAISDITKADWKTTYLGVQSTVDYQFYDAFYFFLSARAGLNMSMLVRGRQEIDNAAYNLVHHSELSGIRFQPLVGVYAKYYLTKNGYLSAGLNLSTNFKIGNNTDHVAINTTQIVFGGYFDLIKR